MILITGGTGLIGSFIIKELLKSGFKVRLLKRSTSDISLIKDLDQNIDIVEGDLLDIGSLKAAFLGIEYVIHSAGFISFEKKDREKLYKINVEGTANLINVALEFPISKFIHISSVASIGKNKNSNEVEETLKWDGEASSEYAKSKYLGELEVWRGGSEGLSIAILNPSIVLGPGDWRQGSTTLFKYIWDENLFYTAGTINYVDVRDVAIAAVSLLTNPVLNERFILSGGAIEYQSFFKKVAKAFNKRAPLIKISPLLLNILLPIEKIRNLFTDTSPLITKETAKSAVNKTVYINTKAKELLNLSFRDLNDTINWVCTEIVKKI